MARIEEMLVEMGASSINKKYVDNDWDKPKVKIESTKL